MFTAKLRKTIEQLENDKKRLETEKKQLEANLTTVSQQLKQYWQIVYNADQEAIKLNKKTELLKKRYEHYKKISFALKKEKDSLNQHLKNMIHETIAKSCSSSRRCSRKVSRKSSPKASRNTSRKIPRKLPDEEKHVTIVEYSDCSPSEDSEEPPEIPARSDE